MVKKITMKDFFTEVEEIIKKQENMGFLDYVSSNSSAIGEITDTEFNVIAETEMGTNEGIYCNFYLSGNIGSEKGRFYIGCFKTLYEDDEHFIAMAQLGAKFQLAAKKWVQDNKEILNRKGYKVEFYLDDVNIFNVYTDKLDNIKSIKADHKDWNYDKVNIIDLYTLEKIG